MKSSIEEQLERLPLLRGRSLADIEITPLEGLTNESVQLNIDGELYLFRVPGDGTDCYLHRCNEALNTKTAADLGLAPEVFWVDTVSGVMLARYVANSRSLKPDDFRSPAIVDRAVDTLARLHNSGRLFRGRIEPLQMIDHYLALTGTGAEAERRAIAQLLGALGEAHALIEKHEFENVLSPCHVDPNPSNFLLCGDRLWLVDWEFSAMCHPLWDLACLALEADLDTRRESRLLERYYGEGNVCRGKLLKAYQMLVSMTSLAWTAVQIAQRNPRADFATEFWQRYRQALRLQRRCPAVSANAL